ncbi:MAG: diadenylate cyclase CdaA [Synergistales bacterium]|nr:diadenylate cyclase CdaA [Synergistales bacterium]MDY6401522.1 diadenylate cyclase CdaA [Synergistales bacterium]MDY6404629.1 diadenylate cyclase CdaA [Synergistales bacterium]MDY6410532.1 diadenylate cyclase CdaA [Synergistales bacterium]MDY6413768.1 diadenylate cyclase CdaA [Synergistales bacterium]
MWANIRSLIDIAIVSLIIYRILVLLVGTQAIQLVKGVFFVLLLSLLASFLRLRLLSWFLGSSLLALSFAVPIVFQPEVRKMLVELGRGHFYNRPMSADEAEVRVNQIAGALQYLKAHKIGALIVLQREDLLTKYTETAIHLNANITAELIESIFWVNNPLHDGAIVLDKYKIIAAGCYLPLADAPEISRWYGTRHRAGLGVTQVSDALVFIVSEERGEISLAASGRLDKNIKDFQVERLLMHYFVGEQVIKGWKGRLHELKKIFWTDTNNQRPEMGSGGDLVN